MRVAAADEGVSAACLQRMNASASAEAPQDSRRRGIGSLRTCMRSGSSPSDGEAPEACAVRQLPSSTWCLGETPACSFGSSRLSKPPHRHLLEVHVSARLESGRHQRSKYLDRIAAHDRNKRMVEPAQSAHYVAGTSSLPSVALDGASHPNVWKPSNWNHKEY